MQGCLQKNYERALELARGFEQEAPRANAVISICAFYSAREEEITCDFLGRYLALFD